jgi:molecular chaperone DnaJ
MLGIMQTQTVCETCQGEGTVIKNKCSHCHGEGIVKGEKQVEVELPAGLIEGYAYNFQGKGGAGRRNGIDGDLQILVHEKPHPELVRDGCDLVYNLLLTIPQAVLGTSLEVPTHDGKAKITIPSGTQPGTVLRLKGKGIPDINGYGHQKGDEIINITVYMPETLNKEERKAIETLASSDNIKPSTGIKDKIFSHFRAYFKK